MALRRESGVLSFLLPPITLSKEEKRCMGLFHLNVSAT
jgi:hypothetical protein